MNDDKKYYNLLNNGSFCAMPFVSVMINTDSAIKFCCIASGPESKLINSNNHKTYEAGKNSIKETWNSDALQSVRQAMIKGEKVAACSHCYYQEKIGKTSSRQMMTDEWISRIGKDEFFKNIDLATSSNFTADLPLFYLDLRLSNLCNLKCRMCSPFNSSQIAKEHFELYEIADYQRIWLDTWIRNPVHLQNKSIWQDSNFLWDELIGLMPKLKKVYMTGGEPTLIENNYRFMKEAIAANLHNQIELFFNINCTNVTDEFINLISHFKNVGINASLDGYDTVNDYIRYPSKWTKISENFEKLAQIKNLKLNITPVIQTYNVLDCINMLSYAEDVGNKYDKDIGVDFLINRHPNYLDVTILPNNLRLESAENLKKYRNTSLRYKNNWLVKNSVDSIINLMESPRHDNYKILTEKFLSITQIFDLKRNQSFEQTFPEISKALKDEQS